MSASSSSLSSSPSTPRRPLPLLALSALAMTGFICIMTETLPAGLLPQIGAGLHVSSSLAGQMVTAYALGSLLAAIPTTLATRGWRRRNALLLSIVGFLLFNTVTAVSDSYVLTLAARFMAGVSAGLAWSLLAGYARRLVTVAQQGSAMAVAMVGTPIALSLGVPAGTWLGAGIGWRSAFGVMSGLTVLLVVWVLTQVPDYPGQSDRDRLSLLPVLRLPGVRPVLATVIAWMLAHNILYTYVAPLVAPAGLLGQVDVVLLVFGLAALASIAVTGRLVDHHLRSTVLWSLFVFVGVSLGLGVFARNPLWVYGLVAVWGLTFGGAATLLQTSLADAAGHAADLALSMNVVAWNGAIAAGGVLGGVLLHTWGAASFVYVVAPLAGVACLIAACARHHGFRPGRRTSEDAVIGH